MTLPCPLRVSKQKVTVFDFYLTLLSLALVGSSVDIEIVEPTDAHKELGNTEFG
jgi:hypothetical protein